MPDLVTSMAEVAVAEELNKFWEANQVLTPQVKGLGS